VFIPGNSYRFGISFLCTTADTTFHLVLQYTETGGAERFRYVINKTASRGIWSTWENKAFDEYTNVDTTKPVYLYVETSGDGAGTRDFYIDDMYGDDNITTDTQAPDQNGEATVSVEIVNTIAYEAFIPTEIPLINKDTDYQDFNIGIQPINYGHSERGPATPINLNGRSIDVYVSSLAIDGTDTSNHNFALTNDIPEDTTYIDYYVFNENKGDTPVSNKALLTNIPEPTDKTTQATKTCYIKVSNWPSGLAMTTYTDTLSFTFKLKSA
jgi:hypothetical protein